MHNLLTPLNPKQQEAVLATDGPVLILAGPGSGKTATLTTRIAYLMQEKGVRPEHILAVTFTNKAAGEMRERLERLLKKYGMPPGAATIGTFHSLGVKILRAHAPAAGLPPGFSIFDKDDTLSILKDAIAETRINPKQFPAPALLRAISGAKNELLTPDQYAETQDLSELYPATIHKIYTAYQEGLKKAGALDFDDLLMRTVLLFNAHPNILAEYQEQFHYIHVDEYQDTNHTQYVLVQQLANKHKNIAVVGDDAQAIYAFRGADFRNILNFELDWPEARTIILDQNYRSVQNILDAAGSVISQNTLQKQKTLWTEKDGGERIMLATAANERDEARFVLSKVYSLIERGSLLKDMVILYRTNAQSRAFEEAFIHANLPYNIIGGVGFYQRREVKDILSYLRYLQNRDDHVSLKRVINIPPRGIGKKTLSAVLTGATSSLRAAEQKHVAGFSTLMESLHKEMQVKTLSEFLTHLVGALDYEEYLREHTMNADERWDNVQELIGFAQKYDGEAPLEGVQKLLEDTALMSDTDQMQDKNNIINMMTLHAAKGLEFSTVFLVGMEDGILPHSRALFKASDLEEERRLCYVGLTRAKERVYLSCALQRTYLGSTDANPPSRFLSEIPEHLITFDGEEASIQLD